MQNDNDLLIELLFFMSGINSSLLQMTCCVNGERESEVK